MSAFNGESAVGFDYPYVPDWGNRDGPAQWEEEQLLDLPGVPEPGDFSDGAPVAAPTAFDGLEAPGPGDDWFERAILLPGQVAAGVILSPTSFTIQIFNSFRKTAKVFTDFNNFAGEGVVITNLPTLPRTLAPLDGLTLELQILTSGPPTILGYLQFDVGAAQLILLVSGQRGILIPFPPEAPMTERLQFLTDIMERLDGKERRVTLRATPRQIFDMNLLTDGPARERLNMMLLGAQASQLNVPVWFESMILTGGATAGTDTVTVDSTLYRDIRVGSLAVVYQDEENYQVMVVESLTSTTITFQATLLDDYAAGAQVMPVRSGYVSEIARGDKAQVAAQHTRLMFTVIDNDVDLSSTAGFPAFEGKVLLSDPNMIDGTLPEALDRRMVRYDNQTGIPQVESDWPMSRRSHSKTFKSGSRQRLWEVRQLLHALRGRAVSFFIPTFYDDFTPTQDVSAGSTTITVKNVGYTSFAQGRQPADVVRLLLKTGASSVRRVVGSIELGPDEEQIEVASAWGIGGSPAEIDRVEIVEKVRLDDDEVVLRHLDSNGQASIEVPVKAVLE